VWPDVVVVDDEDDGDEDEDDDDEVVGADVAGCNPELGDVLVLGVLDPECARGTVAAIATPPATLAAVTPQVTTDIRTSLRRASRSMSTPPQRLNGSPPTVTRPGERVMSRASISTLRSNSQERARPVRSPRLLTGRADSARSGQLL